MNRPASDFDSGHNTSAAWIGAQQSLSDDDNDDDVAQEHGRPARVLYDFEGKAEFRELTLAAGDELTIIKELHEGWSLANYNSEVGLVPKAYYIYTAEFKASPSTFSNHSRQRTVTDNDDRTPRTSPRNTPPPLTPNATGDWISFPNFRQSLLGGKSINRFSSFVTTGAEAWVLNGSNDVAEQPAFSHSRDHSRLGSEDDDAGGEVEEEEEPHHDGSIAKERAALEANRHFVEAGPAWKSKLPPFRVLVHTPEKRTNAITGSYTIYHVTALFYPERSPDDTSPPAPPTRITVHRRFSHFVFLHTALSRRLPGIALPPLPEKQYAGRFSQEFVEARRGDLERYLSRVVRHPVARYAEAVTFFLSCDNEQEWRRQVPEHLNLPPAGPAFYARVFHPAFNVDAEEARQAVERFDVHTRAVKRGVQGLRGVWGKWRGARAEMAVAGRMMAYAVYSMISARPMVKSGAEQQPQQLVIEEDSDEEEEEDVATKGKKGGVNSLGAWCWRDECEECLRLTKNIRQMADTMCDIADMQEQNARQASLSLHESLKDYAHPNRLYSSVIETHRATLSRYQNAAVSKPDDDVAARCETVLNTTMAEFDVYHSQKVDDFETLFCAHLDAELAFHTAALAKLQAARDAFNYADPDEEGLAVRQSKQEVTLLGMGGDVGVGVGSTGGARGKARDRVDPPLTMPCPHVFDSAPMRPVSVAIQEGVGMLIGGAGRASVFGKFW